MIRPANLEDFLDVLIMAKKFIEVSPYKSMHSMTKLQSVVFDCIVSKDKIIFISEHGMLVGMLSEFIYGDCLIATELAWWVDPEYRGTSEGKELLTSFEGWAKDKGCKYITMISLDEGLGKYYEKCGYLLTERSYMREL